MTTTNMIEFMKFLGISTVVLFLICCLETIIAAKYHEVQDRLRLRKLEKKYIKELEQELRKQFNEAMKK